MTPERYQRLRQTLDQRQPDLTLITDQMHKPRNIAALVRTADAVGVSELHMVSSKEQQRPFKGTALGSQQWVSLVKHESMHEAIISLQARGVKVYAAHFSDRAKEYRQVDYTVPCALLLGNEKAGVSEEAASLADEHITIPMMGMVESFNVSVAAAIILSEARNQRVEAGMYQQPQLAPNVYWETFFRWAHPQVAKYCHKNHLPYPDICKVSGEIIEPADWYQSVRAKKM